jgi:hypothetical protein
MTYRHQGGLEAVQPRDDDLAISVGPMRGLVIEPCGMWGVVTLGEPGHERPHITVVIIAKPGRKPMP